MEWTKDRGEFSFTRLICFVLFAHFQCNGERNERNEARNEQKNKDKARVKRERTEQKS